MPLYLFKNRNYVVLSLCASVATAMFYGLNIIWPQQISALYAGSGKSGAWMAVSTHAPDSLSAHQTDERGHTVYFDGRRNLRSSPGITSRETHRQDKMATRCCLLHLDSVLERNGGHN